MKKTYQAPIAEQTKIRLQRMVALSGGETTQGKVHNPDEEVDAGNALSKRRGVFNTSDFEDKLW